MAHRAGSDDRQQIERGEIAGDAAGDLDECGDEHRVEGETVLTYEKPQVGGGAVSNFDPAFKPDGKVLDSGYFALQAESHPVEFRTVELLPLAADTCGG